MTVNNMCASNHTAYSERRTVHLITDPEISIMPMLMGQDAIDVIDGALAGQGRVVPPIQVKQVRYVPGSSLVVQSVASVVWSTGDQTTETFVVSVGRRHPEGVAVVDVDDHRVAVWRFPDDPYLPGLGAAMRGESVLAMFRELGVEASEVSLRRRAYRPSRRAVIEATTPSAKLYLKVVRPSRVADLQKRHASMAGIVPVPRSHGWNQKLGIVVLEAMTGATMRTTLATADVPLPAAGAVVGLLDALPAPPAVPTVVHGPGNRAAEFAGLLTAVVPELAHEIESIASACAGAASMPHAEQVPVHGDYHSSQILVDRGRIAGLVDIDAAGLGHRVHDLAQLLAHLAVLGQENPSVRYNTYGADLVQAFDRLVDPMDLRLNVAGAILGFATGPFRVQEHDWPANTERRVRLAQEWVRSADAT